MKYIKSMYIRAFKFTCCIFVCLSQSCIPKDYVESRYIKIINNSNKNLIYILSENGEFKKPIYNEDIRLLHKYEKDSFSCPDYTWEVMAKQSFNKKINIYVVDELLLSQHDGVIDSIFNNRDYLHLYSLDIHYLEKYKWEIIFTP